MFLACEHKLLFVVAVSLWHFITKAAADMGVLFFTVLVVWLIYEGIAQIVAEVKAKQMNEAYKKLREIAEGKSKDDGG